MSALTDRINPYTVRKSRHRVKVRYPCNIAVTVDELYAQLSCPFHGYVHVGKVEVLPLFPADKATL